MCHKQKNNSVISLLLVLMLLLAPLSVFAADDAANPSNTPATSPVAAQSATSVSSTAPADDASIGILTGGAMVPAGEIATASAAFLQPTKLTDFINEVQTWFADAEISAAGPSGDLQHTQGAISRDSLATMYGNETDTLSKLEMSGWQIKKWMEWAAARYGKFDPDTDLTVTWSGSGLPDQFSGLEYTIDLTKDEGERISIAAFTGDGDSEPFVDSARYKVAVNSAQAATLLTSGAVFDSDELSDPDAPVTLETNCKKDLSIGTDLVSLMAYYIEVEQNGVINANALEKNWSLIHLDWDPRERSQAVFLINKNKISYANDAAVTKTDLEPFDFVDIFSFNDFHGTLDNTVSTSNPGAAKFVAYAKSQREASLGDSMILAGGDNYQGSAMSNLLKGAPVSKMMELLGVKYSAIGNHEFDWGSDRLSVWESQGITRFLCANIFKHGTEDLADFCTPTAIETLPNGVKIGLIGLATPSTADVVKADYVNPFDFSNQYAEIVTPLVNELKVNQGCDLVIALTHLGAGGNGANVSGEVSQLVNQCPTLDGVITGHTHSNVAGSVSGSTIPVVQAAYNGRRLGKLSYVLEDGKIMEIGGVKQATASTTAVPTSGTAPVDAEMVSIYNGFATELEPILNKEVGHFNRKIDSRSISADWATQLVYDFIKKETGTPYILIQNSGGWRDTGVSQSLPKLAVEPVTRSYLFTLMPFDNEIVLMDMTGSALLTDLLNYQGPPNLGSSPNYAGVYKDGSDWYLTETHQKIDPEAIYKVACNDFMFVPGANGLGGDNYKFSSGFNSFYMGKPLRDAMEEQLVRRDSLASDAAFKSLTADEGKIVWNQTESRYEIIVGHTVTSLTLHGTLAEGASFTVSGNRDFEQGTNTATLRVTAPNGAVEAYALRVTSVVKEDQPQPAAFELKVTPQGELNYLVEIPVPTPGATAAEYSFDGTTWGENRSRTANPGETVIGYVRYKDVDQFNASPARSALAILPLFKVKTPTASSAGDTFKDSVAITLSTATPGAEIYYTTNGDAPNAVRGTRYTGPVLLEQTTTLSAIAVKSGMADSDLFTGVWKKQTVTETDTKPDTKPEAKPVRYNVRFLGAGGQFKDGKTVRTLLITKGRALGVHYAPLRKGYEFLGWYTKKTGGTKVPVTRVVNKATTLYAHWVLLGKVSTNGPKLNLRTKAWGKIIGQYKRGTKVRVYSRVGDWYKVVVENKTGYMHKDYIKLASVK